MKNNTLILAFCVFMLTSNALAQIKVNSSGFVGINNTNPAYRLDVAGTLKMTHNSNTILFDGSALYPNNGYPTLGTSGSSWYQLYVVQGYFYYDPIIMSDLNQKTNIAEITSVKEKVKLLKPVTYNLLADDNFIKDQPINNLQYGFVAQELQELFPDLVISRDDGTFGIRYTGLVPILVQTIKEQQTEIDALAKRISDLEKKVQ